MSKDKAEQILKRHTLKKTDLRIQLVDLFLTKGKTLSQADIIKDLEKKSGPVDRVSIYRNLNQLKSAGIVHEIESNKYVSCSHDCEHHGHVLMYCQSCESHTEITDHEKLNVFFKAMGFFHFLSERRTVFLKGICENCTNS